jgi:hypothetical protein
VRRLIVEISEEKLNRAYGIGVRLWSALGDVYNDLYRSMPILNYTKTLLNSTSYGALVSLTKAYGVAIFEVNRDMDVVMLDLENAGLNRLDFTDVDPEYLIHINNAEEEFSFIIGRFRSTRDYFFELSDEKMILVRFYMSSRNNVRLAVLVSLRAGILRAVARRLERLGWRRKLIFEIRRTVRSIKYTD